MMKFNFATGILIILLLAFTLPACKKDVYRGNSGGGSVSPPPVNPPTPPPTPPVSCPGKPYIIATLVPVGNLSSARINLLSASAGNKILFIGGYHEGQNWWNEPVPVDIYDFVRNTWSTYSITPETGNLTHFRFGAAVAAVGNKILFGGGGDNYGDNQTSKVDIYDAETNTWSTQQLSSERQGLAAASVGKKVLFAGGFGYPYGTSAWGEFSTVDIYDDATNTWSIAQLSQARMELSATTSGSKVYFAGGRSGLNAVNTIDIYDAATNTWSVSAMQYPRFAMSSVGLDNKVFWGGGGTRISTPGDGNNENVEILNTSTGATLTNCMAARRNFKAVQKGNYIVFFTGDAGDGSRGTEFDIYDISTDTWSVGKLSQKIFNATIISVNNTIYVAGGFNGTTYSSQVWELTF